MTGPREFRTYASLAIVGLIFGCSISSGRTGEIPDDAADRFGRAVSEVLNSGSLPGYVLLSELATKRAEVLDTGDAFWKGVTAGLLARPHSQAALVTYVRKLTGAERARLIPLTRQLPEVADILAVVAPSEGGQPRPFEDEVLRRMAHPGPAARRALISRATDTAYPRSDELVERIASNPALVEDARDDLEAMRSANDDKQFGLFLRYAAARPLQLSTAEIARGLVHANPGVERAALSVLAGRPRDGLQPFLPQLRELVRNSRDGAVLPLAVELLARLSPDTAAGLLASRGSEDGFWRSDLGVGALAALTRTPAGIDTVAAGTAGMPQNEIYASEDCRVLPATIELFTRRAGAEDIAAVMFAALEAVLRRDRSDGCDPAGIASALDAAAGRFAAMGASPGDFAARFYRFAATPATTASTPDSKETKALVATFKQAGATRSAIMSDPNRLRGVVLDPTMPLHPVVAALILALPSDHPFLFSLRETLGPVPGGSLTDHVRTQRDVLVRVLTTTLRNEGWSLGQLDNVASISVASESPDVDAAAFDVILNAGEPERLLAYFDRSALAGTSKSAIAKIRALRAFAAAIRQMPDPSIAYTPPRLAWLMQQLPDHGLRGRVVRVLGPRPGGTSLHVDAIAAVISRAALERSGKGAVGACLDAAALGPYSKLGIGLTLLEASESQSYEGEPWPSVCARLLAPSDRDRLTDPGVVLVSLMSRGDAEALPGAEASARLSTLDGIWKEASGRPLGNLGQKRIAETVAAIAPSLGWGVDDFSTLRRWDSQLRPAFSDQASGVRTEWLKRGALLAGMALPGTVAVHLSFWLLLLAAYPRSLRLQTHVFYNPWVRKILGFGYVDLLLVWFAPMRRRLFEPFREVLTGELERVGAGSAFGAYFPKSEILPVTRTDLEREIRHAERAALTGTLPASAGAVTDALAQWRGPTWLFGPSGRGKTSYLRYTLTANARVRFPFIYLRASECGADLLQAVCSRLGGLGNDKYLVASLIHAGLFDVYVDGLNEVDRERQEVVVRFIVDHRSANIFVASQEVGVSLPSRLSTFYLLPLTRGQMKEFLASRTASLDAAAPIRDEVFVAKTALFIDELAADAELDPDAEPGDAEARRRRELAASFIATLANPIDLETAASLLSLDIEPDPLRLQEQQFELVAQDYESRLGRPFPIAELSKSVLSARKDNRSELDAAVFGTAIAVLEERKQVRRMSIADIGRGSVTEFRFRHDKIRDFYTHFAFLDDEQARFELARDDRFSGVYDYLARKLPAVAASDLREYLLSVAVDSNDHRLSDRFLQHLRWRTLLDQTDPPWLLEYSSPDMGKALETFEQLAARRKQIEGEMNGLRTAIDAERLPARILSARTAETLEVGIVTLFEKLGATIRPTPGGSAPIVETPSHRSFLLFCIAGNGIFTSVATVGIRARLAQSHGRKLLVINPAPDDEPGLRDWARVSDWAQELGGEELATIGTLEFHRLVARSINEQNTGLFWRHLMDRSGLSGGTPIAPLPLKRPGLIK